MWYLNQDGETYVQDESRVNEEPTAEEKAASEKILTENAAEVEKQAIAAQTGAGAPGAAGEAGVAEDGIRGMSAETGSNTAARTLAALMVMTILGAAAFVARRKFFA